MAIPKMEKLRNDFGWVDGTHYPLEMSEYLEECEIKLRKILHEITERYAHTINNDLRVKWERTRFDLECTPIANQDAPFYEWERSNEIRLLGHVLYNREQERIKQHYNCMINLTYDVEFHWLRRPNHYTNYYSLRFMDMLKEADIKFTCGDIKWISDESNGQMFGELFQIDFSKQISEEYAKELCKEFNRLNDVNGEI